MSALPPTVLQDAERDSVLLSLKNAIITLNNTYESKKSTIPSRNYSDWQQGGLKSLDLINSARGNLTDDEFTEKTGIIIQSILNSDRMGWFKPSDLKDMASDNLNKMATNLQSDPAQVTRVLAAVKSAATGEEMPEIPIKTADASIQSFKDFFKDKPNLRKAGKYAAVTGGVLGGAYIANKMYKHFKDKRDSAKAKESPLNDK